MSMQSRRSFLGKAIATGALANLPFLSRAHAAPLYNVIIVYVPDGVVPSLWYPTGSETSFTLPAMSQPLEAIKSDCVFLQGISMYAGEPTHQGGTKKVITATGPQSLDVVLGQKLKGSSPFDAVQLGVASTFEDGSGSISFIGPGQQAKPDDNPLNVFSRLFGDVKPMTGMGMSGPDLGARQRQSVLDAIKGDLTSLQARLGGTEKSRLDNHMQFLRDIEARASMMIAPGAACDVNSFNKVGFKVDPNDYNYPKVYHQAENFPLVGQLQMDLTVLALSCNLTRVVTLMWSHAVSPTKVPGLAVTLGNHDSSHYGTMATSDNARQFVLYRRWFMERFVSLVQALKRTPFGDGNLFDSTVLLICSDIGDGDLHEHKNVPFVVAGGSKTGMHGGRYLDFTGKGMGGQNETHAKILVSIANAVGVKIDSFGYTGMGTGPLPKLFG
jgi:Protein of unknown function (DUF1552)